MLIDITDVFLEQMDFKFEKVHIMFYKSYIFFQVEDQLWEQLRVPLYFQTKGQLYNRLDDQLYKQLQLRIILSKFK